MIQRALAIALVIAGLVWSMIFPKKMTLDADMVLSVGLGLGLVVTGLVVLFGTRERLRNSVVSTLLLWSLIGNAYLLAWQHGVAASLMASIEQPNQAMQTDRPSPDR